MNKRNIIAEIEARKQRGDGYWSEASLSIWNLDLCISRDIGADEKRGPRISVYVPAITACIEIAVKWAVRELVDYGPPFADRIAGFKDLLRFDLEITRALHSRKVTFGDLISHLMGVSSIGDICSSLEVLLGCSLQKVLADVKEYVEPHPSTYLGPDAIVEEWDSGTPGAIVEDVNVLFSSLAALFKHRHRIVHEARFNEVSAADLHVYLTHSVVFIDALEELVEQTLRPGVPRSGMGSSLYASVTAQNAGERMEAAVEKVLSLLASRALEPADAEAWGVIDPTSAFNASQQAFLAHLEREIEFDAANAGGIAANGARHRDAVLRQEMYEQREKRLLKIAAELEGASEP